MDDKLAEETTGIYSTIVTEFHEWDDISVEEFGKLIDQVTTMCVFGVEFATDVQPAWDCHEASASIFVEDDANDNWEWDADRCGTVADAKDYLGLLDVIRSTGKEMGAFESCLFHLGMLAERVNVRHREPFALRGREQLNNLRLSREKAHGTPEEITQRQDEMYQYYQGLRETGSKPQEATERTAMHFAVSTRTVQRARKKFEKNSCDTS